MRKHHTEDKRCVCCGRTLIEGEHDEAYHGACAYCIDVCIAEHLRECEEGGCDDPEVCLATWLAD